MLIFFFIRTDDVFSLLKTNFTQSEEDAPRKRNYQRMTLFPKLRRMILRIGKPHTEGSLTAREASELFNNTKGK